MGTSWGKVSGWRGRRRGHPSVAGAGAAGRGGLAAGSSPAARAFPPNAFTSGASARHPPISQRRGNARCPKRRAAPPAEVTANGERGLSASAGEPRSAAHRPLRSGSRSRSPRAVPCAHGPRPIPGPQRRSAKVGLRFCRWEVGNKTPGRSGQRLAGGGEGEGWSGKRRV